MLRNRTLHGIVKLTPSGLKIKVAFIFSLVFRFGRLISFLFLLLYGELCLAANTQDLEELTRIAIENNKDLKAAKYIIGQAQARLIQAGLWSNPSLVLSDIDDKLITNEGEYTKSAGFSQAFPVSGRIGKQKKLARVDIALAIAEINNAKRLLRGQVASSYFNLLITEKRLEQVQRLLTLDKELIDVTQNRYKAAEVSELDANLAQVEFQRVIQERDLLLNQQISQTAQLNQLLGRPATSPLHLDKKPPSLSGLPTLINILDRAVRCRPDMQMLWLTLDKARANRELAQAERWGDWNLEIGIQKSRQFVEGAPPQTPDKALGLNLTIPLPLLNQNQGRIMESSLMGAQAAGKIRALKLTIETEITTTYKQLGILKTTLINNEQNALKFGFKNIELAKKAYQNGLLSFLGLVQIQRQQNELQMNYLTIKDQYIQSLVKFCTAIGNPSQTQCYYQTARMS